MFKEVIVVRNDLNLSVGKTAAQVAHAAVECYVKSDPRIRKKWMDEGQKKVVLSAGPEEIKSIIEKCRKNKTNFCVIFDAGLTEIPPNTLTCIGIGPDKEDVIDKITGSLPLLK